MVDFGQLLSIDLSKLEAFADSWNDIRKRIEDVQSGFKDDVLTPLENEDWKGDAAKSARNRCTEIHDEIGALARQADGARSYTEKLAGVVDDSLSLKKLQRDAASLRDEITSKGLSVVDGDKVAWVVARAPGPLSEQERQRREEKQQEADELQQRLDELVEEATENDERIADALKVVFGTTHNFDAGAREFGSEEDEKGWKDYETHAELMAVEAAMRHHFEYTEAADLLKHWLEESGEPYEVDARQMLDDMPAFREDVDQAIEDVETEPDGTFSTGWQDSAPNVDNGAKSRNWYYALNNFEYRVVGEKNGDETSYHVEVRKNYDWGIPSEGRGNLQKGPVELEQADIAHLHSTGMARDFKVHGETGKMTKPN
ncbi:hypothetical protein SAMN04487819_108249 [Actinopolyspora alba]|uniref:Uncharacterized protein n=2 Tax=Actinopolyspora alba TaxID=673379 RepID=A0A1I1YA14_9ACTN|nr:hypothetical protein SAMN04487819_108249 [Actinopolyspora alba]